MKVFCPNCGTENEGTPGSRVTCRACTASFEVPFASGMATPQPPPQQPAQPPFGGRPVQTFDRPPPAQPPQPVAVSPPPNVWSPNAPGVFVSAPSSGGQTNTLAIISLVSAMVGCLCMPAIGSIAGIITGIIALSQINQAGGAQKGRELAIGGIAVSVLGCMGWLAYFVIAAISGR